MPAMGNALKKDKGRATTPGGRTVRLTKGKSEADVETFDAEQLEQLGMLSSCECHGSPLPRVCRVRCSVVTRGHSVRVA